MFQHDLRENNCSWQEKELKIIEQEYFDLIRVTDKYCEFQSKNTKHYWILFKQSFNQAKQSICIYHKHSLKQPFYHKHWKAHNIEQAIKSIQNHDRYVLKQVQPKRF